MSKIQELINELCPNGVEYKPLCEITHLTAGERITKEMMNDKLEYSVYGGGVQPTGKYSKYNKMHSITISRAGSAGFVNWVEDKFWATDVCFVASELDKNYNIKFIYYYVKNQQKEIQKHIYGGNLPKLNKEYLWNLHVPVPPMEIQCEIVHILDDFTLLSAELSAELKARQKQYEYYRDELLNFKTDIIYKKLGDIFTFRNGLNKGKEFFGKGTTFIKYTDVYNNRILRKENITEYVECTEEEKTKLKVSRGDVLFTRTSETAEDVGWSAVMLDNIDNCVFNGFTIKATPITDDLLPEYCAYCFSTYSFRKYVTQNCAFTTRASLTGNTIAQYKMAIPSHKIQKRIVDVLDNFETICNSLNIGLPAEIEKRQQQYKFYRDLLLTFAEQGDSILREEKRREEKRREEKRREEKRREET